MHTAHVTNRKCQLFQSSESENHLVNPVQLLNFATLLFPAFRSQPASVSFLLFASTAKQLRPPCNRRKLWHLRITPSQDGRDATSAPSHPFYDDVSAKNSMSIRGDILLLRAFTFSPWQSVSSVIQLPSAASGMAAAALPAVHITQCSGPNAFRIKGLFDATGEISGGKPVYRKRDGEYVLHHWSPTGEWIIAGAADFLDKTGRGWAVLENSTLVRAALSLSEWKVVPGSKQIMCVEAFAYGL